MCVSLELQAARERSSIVVGATYRQISEFIPKLERATNELGPLLKSVGGLSSERLKKGAAPSLEREKFVEIYKIYAQAFFLKKKLEGVIAFLTPPRLACLEMSIFKEHCPKEIENVKGWVDSLESDVFKLRQLFTEFEKGIRSLHVQLISDKFPEKKEGNPLSFRADLLLRDPFLLECQNQDVLQHSQPLSLQYDVLIHCLNEGSADACTFFNALTLRTGSVDGDRVALRKEANGNLKAYQGFIKIVFASFILEEQFNRSQAYLEKRSNLWMVLSDLKKYCPELYSQICLVDSAFKMTMGQLETKKTMLQSSRDRVLSLLGNGTNVLTMNLFVRKATTTGTLGFLEMTQLYASSRVWGVSGTPISEEISEEEEEPSAQQPLLAQGNGVLAWLKGWNPFVQK